MKGVLLITFCFLPGYLQLKLYNDYVSEDASISIYKDCGVAAAGCNCTYSVFPVIKDFKHRSLRIMKCKTFSNLHHLPSITDVLDVSDNTVYDMDKVLWLIMERHVVLLNMKSNMISKLSISNLNRQHPKAWDYLRYLNLENNAIRVVEKGYFRYLCNLTHLILKDNLISSLDKGALSFLVTLEHLDLSGNPLRTLQADIFYNTHPQQLLYLNLSRCSLETIADSLFKSTIFLQKLDLSHNKLGFLSSRLMNTLMRLRHLNLSYNQFETFPTQALQSFRRLDSVTLNGVPLLRLGKDEVSGINVSVISISSTSLRVVHADAFHNLPYLKELNMRENRALTYLHPRAFQKLESLRDMDLSMSNIHVLPEELSNNILRLQINVINNPLWCVCDNNWIANNLQSSRQLKTVFLYKDLLSCIHYETVRPSRGRPFTLAESRHFKNLSVNSTSFASECPPQILHPLSNSSTELMEEDTVILECLTTGKPRPDIYWTFPDEDLKIQSNEVVSNGKRIKIRDGLLEISRARVSDSGRYTCTAFNSAGKMSFSYILMVHTRQLQLVPLTAGSNYITVTWKGPARHHADYYYIGYREVEPLATGNYHLPFSKVYSIQHLWRSFTAHKLQPAHSYQLCLIHKQAKYFFTNVSNTDIHRISFPLVFRKGHCVQVDTKYSIEHLYGHGIYRVAHHSTVYMMFGMLATLVVLIFLTSLAYHRRCKKLRRLHKQNRYSTIGVRKGDTVQLEVLLEGHSPQYNSKTSLLSHNSE